MSHRSLKSSIRENRKNVKYIGDQQSQQQDEDSLNDVDNFYLTGVNFQHTQRKTAASWKFRDFKNQSSTEFFSSASNFFKSKMNPSSPFSSPKSILSSENLPGYFSKSPKGFLLEGSQFSKMDNDCVKDKLKFKSVVQEPEKVGKKQSILYKRSDSNTTEQKHHEQKIIKELCTPVQFHPVRKDKADFYFEKQLQNSAKNQRQERYYNPQQEKLHEQRKYHAYYKNQGKIFERNNHFQIEDDLDVMMLRKANTENLLPRKLNIISNSDNTSKIKIKHYQLGNRYSGMFSTALTHQDLCEVSKINVQNNNFNKNSFQQLLEACPQNIVNLNFKDNKLTFNGCENLQRVLDSSQYDKLSILNLEKNAILDAGFSVVVQNLIKSNSKLKKLNVSKNFISDNSMVDLCEYLKKPSTSLCELYLHWNKITPVGGVHIADGLKENKQLIVIDLSHNCLGTKKSKNAKSVGVYLIESLSPVVRHLDLSFNEFTTQESHDINDSLVENHTLYGLHFEGNTGVIVDERGFLKIPEKDDLIEQQMMRKNFLKKRIKGVQTLGFNKMYRQIPVDACWICDGWVQTKFEYDIKSSGRINYYPVFLHLDFENYSPILMEKDKENEKVCFSYRMIPPNTKIRYFFTNPLNNKITHNKNTGLLLEKINNKEDQEPVDCQYIDGSIRTYNLPKKINYIAPIQKKNNIINNRYEVLVNAKPRDNGGYFQIQKEEAWTFPISLFKDYKVDNEEILTQCFETDWKNSKITKLIKNESELQDIKSLLRENYEKIKASYKMYSSLGMIGDVFAITQNERTILDQNLKLKDIDINFIMTNQMPEQHPRNPQRGLIRFQFMEILFRLALDKYIKSKRTTSQLEALQIFFDEGLTQLLDQSENYQYWRDNRYWNEDCDLLLKDNLEFLTGLYNRFAGTKREKMAYTHLKFMTLPEFKELITQFEIVDDWFGERDIPVSYNLAMMTQVDELNQERFMQMSFVEFLEAISRVAEKLSPVPIGEFPEDFTEEERVFQPLHVKLETMFYQMQIKQNEENNNNNNSQMQQSQSSRTDTRRASASIKIEGLKNIREKQNTYVNPSTPKSQDRYQLNRRKSQIVQLFSKKRDDAFGKLYGRQRKPSHLTIGGVSVFQSNSDVSPLGSPTKTICQASDMDTLEEHNKEDGTDHSSNSLSSSSSDSSKNSESGDEMHSPSQDKSEITKALNNLKKQSFIYEENSNNNVDTVQKKKNSGTMAKILSRAISKNDITNANRRTSLLTGVSIINQSEKQGLYNKFLKPLRKQSIFVNCDQVQ